MQQPLVLIYNLTFCGTFTAMQLTQHTDYAFRVLLYSLAHSDRLVTITEIANYYQVSRSHLAKVVANLTQKGYLIGVRGQRGGLKLAKKAKHINLGQLVEQFEPLDIVECFQKSTNCVISPSCHLKKVLGEAKKAFLDVLSGYTLADIALSEQELLQAANEQLIQIKHEKS